MKYKTGDCLSFNLGEKGFLAGIVSSALYEKYQIALLNYCKMLAPDESYFNGGEVFGVKYEMGENSVSALDSLNLEPAQIDQAPGIERITEIPVKGIMPSSGFTELEYSPDAILDYFEKNLLIRTGGAANDTANTLPFEKKSLLSLTEFIASVPAPNELPTVKLYLKKDSSIYYWQIYGSSHEPVSLVTHWGKLGETGEFVETLDKELEEINTIYQQGINAKKTEGYSEWTNHAEMILQFATSDSWGGTEDLDFRNEISDYLDKYLFWTGNGASTGGDIGSGTVNIFFECVSPELVVNTIVQALQEKKVEQPFLIAQQSFPESNDLSDGEQVIKVLYPADFKSEFFY